MKSDKFNTWLDGMGWSENPFTLKIDPSLFVGYADELERLKRHVNEGHKIALVTGSTGSGKTTLLLLLKDLYSRECDVIYLGKPPKMEEIVNVFTSKFKPSIIEKIKGLDVHIHNLPDYVNRKSKKKILMMVDEIHESDVEVLEWIRTLGDHISHLQIIMSGLPTTDEFLRKNLETLRNRITAKVDLISLSESETSEFIKKRIESVGGTGMRPFDQDLVRQIYRRTGGFPREIIKISNELVERKFDGETMDVSKTVGTPRDEPAKSETHVESETSEKKSFSMSNDFIRDMPSKQRRILKILSQKDDMYPSEIAGELGLDKYKTKQHAVRSMNNILQRLLKDGYVQRAPRGKGFVYYLEPKVRSVLTEA